MTTMTDHPFDTDTRVRATAPGEYAATISDRWDALGGTPNGGYLLAVCLRALGEDSPLPDPLVASATYLRPPVAGPAEVHTETVRAGRRVVTREARLMQDGGEAVRVVASFTDLANAAGRTTELGTPPRLAAPEQLTDLLGGGSLPGVSITERLEYRAAEPPGWATGRPSGEPAIEFWMRFRDGRDADPIALAMLVDAAAPAILELGETGSATVQLTVHLRAHPAPGWLACRATTRHVASGYHEEDFEIWDSSGVLVAQSRQLALLRT
jgi:acyl-CoA thioesterase